MDICFFLKVTLYCKKIAQCKPHVEIHLKMSIKVPEISRNEEFFSKSFSIKASLKTNIWLEEFTFNLNQLLRQFWKECHTYCVKSIFELSLGVSCPWSMRCQGSLWRPLFLRFTMGPLGFFFNFFTFQISLLFMVFSKGDLISENVENPEPILFCA